MSLLFIQILCTFSTIFKNIVTFYVPIFYLFELHYIHNFLEHQELYLFMSLFFIPNLCSFYVFFWNIRNCIYLCPYFLYKFRSCLCYFQKTSGTVFIYVPVFYSKFMQFFYVFFGTLGTVFIYVPIFYIFSWFFYVFLMIFFSWFFYFFLMIFFY
jgi:hypothetical protein